MRSFRHRFPKQRVGNHIDTCAKDPTDLFADPGYSQQRIARVGVQIDEYVDIAAVSRVTACN